MSYVPPGESHRGHPPDYVPSPEVIQAETRAIQASWTEEERERRRCYNPAGHHGGEPRVTRADPLTVPVVVVPRDERPLAG